MNKSPLHPEGIAKPSGVWSPAVVVEQPGKLVFISGFTSRDESGAVHGEGDIRAQTRRVCELMQRSMRAAGGDLKDIVRVDVYVRNIDDFAAIHEVRREFFPVDPPASTMVEVSRMVDPRSLIEINAIGVLR
jgi:enamine deaminase RidA (YjgF/YER057c/UK114 family)